MTRLALPSPRYFHFLLVKFKRGTSSFPLPAPPFNMFEPRPRPCEKYGQRSAGRCHWAQQRQSHSVRPTRPTHTSSESPGDRKESRLLRQLLAAHRTRKSGGFRLGAQGRAGGAWRTPSGARLAAGALLIGVKNVTYLRCTMCLGEGGEVRRAAEVVANLLERVPLAAVI
jgi:hypothetical protein